MTADWEAVIEQAMKRAMDRAFEYAGFPLDADRDQKILTPKKYSTTVPVSDGLLEDFEWMDNPADARAELEFREYARRSGEVVCSQEREHVGRCGVCRADV